MFHELPSPRAASSTGAMTDDDEDSNWLRELLQYNRDSRLKFEMCNFLQTVRGLEKKGAAECFNSG